MRIASRTAAVGIALAALTFAATPDIAVAQGYWNGPLSGFFYTPSPRPRPPERTRRYDPRRERAGAERLHAPISKSVETVAVATAGKPAANSALVTVISLRHQSLTVYDSTGPVLPKVSTGQAGYATPTGLFSVIQKNRYHESNIYSGAPMPWMHRITWSGIALHAGVVPNYPASHGCIRLPYDFAPKLWAISRMGMRVVVSPDDTAMHMVTSEKLPQPKLMTTAELDRLVEEVRGTPRVASASSGPIVLASTGAAPSDRVFNPSDVAQRLKKEAAAAVELRKRAATEALAAAAQASALANAAADEVRAAKGELAEAEAIRLSLPPGQDTLQADNRLHLARERLAAAKADDATKNPLAFAAARAAREAEIAADEAPDQARDAARRTEPVSVFVSAKEGMILVRQGFEQVLDTHVEIDDPLEPLGTHVFTAMAPTADGTRLEWSAVTVPSSHGATPSITAMAALERITIPPKVRAEIERRLWTGASLIISDEGISRETGKGTDFVVLTK